jgi:hypothetical protein
MIAGNRTRAALLLLLPLLSCAAPAATPQPDRDSGTPDVRVVVDGAQDVRLVMDQADAVLAIVRAGTAATEEQWRALWNSEGYRRLKQRERALGRAFEDSTFRAFLLSDSMRSREAVLRATVDSWRAADTRAAAARARTYLPAGSVIRARLYPVIKPQTNSFVFELTTDSAAIFMFVDPALTREKLENTLAHELHHVGYAAACPDDDRAAFTEPVWQVRRWIGAFGEGLAMLAAAGSPEAHPHAVSDAGERARWHRDYAAAPADLRRVEAFFEDILSERATGQEITQRAMGFFGDAQGPWYTVGYLMAATIERTLGREALLAVICDPVALLEAYNGAAAEQNARSGTAQLPVWSEGLLEPLRPPGRDR